MKTKVVALVKYDRRGASSRVRFWNLLPALSEKGWDVVVYPLLSDQVLRRFYARGRHDYFGLVGHVLRRIERILTIGSPPIIWAEKEIVHGLPGFLERLLVGSALRKTIIDYDDAVFLNYSDAWLGGFGRERKFQSYAREAACITVGSESLQAQMISWGCRRTRRIPSTVQVASYPLHKHEAGAAIVIGWIGTPKTVHFLENLRRVLPTVARKYPIQFRVVGATWNCEGVDVRSFPWSEESEARIVAEFDVGVMPLVDGPWERAKCGYKLIQYMAAGVVPLGARVGENNIIVQDGVNGYLATEPDEWIEKLLMVCGNPQLRSSVGARARELAMEKYDIRIAAEGMHQVFSEVSGKNTEVAR